MDTRMVGATLQRDSDGARYFVVSEWRTAQDISWVACPVDLVRRVGGLVQRTPSDIDITLDELPAFTLRCDG